jgi:murein DD-endopeptidase MepM/ murein hydrolase activator NlpD
MKVLSNPVITSPYGEGFLQGKKEFHYGLDLIDEKNDRSVFSPLPGLVIYDYDNYNHDERFKKVNTGGNYLIIKHKLNNTIFYFKYLHLTHNLFSDTDIIEAGEKIGEYGNVGYSFGAHLHISAYFKDWSNFDPEIILQGLRV